MASAADERYMRRALALARRGQGTTSPNPMVGCVIVRSGRVLAEGWHRQAGGDHAEIDALEQLGDKARGATVYVTLEPCNHHGRTGPCTEALIAAGVERVVFGLRDPNPRVDGRGARRLKNAGIAVEGGLLAEESAELNRAFIKWVKTGRPWVTLKAAVSLDGKLATRSGDSKWLTGVEARKEAHRLRARHDAILVGAGTIFADDPQLTVRGVPGRSPLRLIVEGRRPIPDKAKARKGAVVFSTQNRPGVVKTPGQPGMKGRVDLGALLDDLGGHDITSVLVEGGAAIHGALWRAGLVDEVVVFVAPKLLGGDGLPMLGGEGAASMAEVSALEDVKVKRLGDDVMIVGRTGEREDATRRGRSGRSR